VADKTLPARGSYGCAVKAEDRWWNWTGSIGRRPCAECRTKKPVCLAVLESLEGRVRPSSLRAWIQVTVLVKNKEKDRRGKRESVPTY
jgi:hypothetical protein